MSKIVNITDKLNFEENPALLAAAAAFSLYGCFEVFVDTLVVCTMTALGILCAGPEIWQSGLEAEALTMAALRNPEA